MEFELSPEEEELAKKDRLVNAWLASGDEASPGDVADVTDASEAYASRIRSQMQEGEITEADVEAVRDDQLIDEYAARLEQLANPEPEEEAERGDAEMEEPEDAGEQPASRGPETSEQQPQQATQQAQAAPQRQYSRAAPRSQQGRQAPQTSQRGTLGEAGGTVPVEQLRELDEMLGFIEEEANFELQNLPPNDRGAAAGKLFVAQQARTVLRNILGEREQGPQDQQ